MVKVSLQKSDRITRTISALETGGATNKHGNLAVLASLTPQVEFRRQKAQSVPFYCVSACVSWIFLNFERKDHLFFMCVVILRVLMSLIPFYACICRISQVLSELLHIHRPKLVLEPGLTHLRAYLGVHGPVEHFSVTDPDDRRCWFGVVSMTGQIERVPSPEAHHRPSTNDWVLRGNWNKERGHILTKLQWNEPRYSIRMISVSS